VSTEPRSTPRAPLLERWRPRVAALSAPALRKLALRLGLDPQRGTTPDSERSRLELVAYWVGSSAIEEDALRRALSQSLPKVMVPRRLLRVDSLPRGPNGKLDRRALPHVALNADETRGEISESAPSGASSSGIEPAETSALFLRSLFRAVLRVETIDLDDDFFANGGDSILVLELVGKARAAGLELRPAQVFRAPTPRALAQEATGPLGVGRSRPESKRRVVPAGYSAPGEARELGVDSATADRHGSGILADRSTDFIPLSPIQIEWLRFAGFSRSPWNFAVSLTLVRRVDESHFRRAVRWIESRHEAFRLRLDAANGSAVLRVAGVGHGLEAWWIDLSTRDPADFDLEIATIARLAQQSLSLSDGPIGRLVLIDLGDGLPSRLLVAVHHLSFDGVSLRTLLDDLAHAVSNLRDGRDPDDGAPHVGASWSEWARRLGRAIESGEFVPSVEPWASLPRESCTVIPVDISLGDPPRERSTRRFRTVLESESTAALVGPANRAFGTRPDDLIRAALLRVLTRRSRAPSLWLDIESHGREDLFAELDVSRTIGWFSSYAPVSIPKCPTGDVAADVIAAKEAVRALPRGGLDYLVLRQLSSGKPDESSLESIHRVRSLPPPNVLLNYLGRIDRPEDSLVSRAGPEIECGDRHPDSVRTHSLEINAWIESTALAGHDQLVVTWGYSDEERRRESVEALASEFLDELGVVLARCLSGEIGGYTASDFPDSGLSQAELDDLLNTLDSDDADSDEDSSNAVRKDRS
jgi:non-ribosomal peptide synthase protein (TIGR01720 family)